MKVCPAYAGMIPSVGIQFVVSWGLSRVCGDDPDSAVYRIEDVKFVPRMRG